MVAIPGHRNSLSIIHGDPDDRSFPVNPVGTSVPWRNSLRVVLLSALCLVESALAANTSPSLEPAVQVASGKLAGTRLEGRSNTIAYLGIPYAAPPLGPLRWRPPRPAPKWEGVREATHYAPACPQLRASWLPFIGWNEDCLYLNVWTDHLEKNTGLSPVIVYFHGGSNTAGYSQLNPVGPALSPLGVVVVSANYRLGPLGFLAHPALSAESPHRSSGNYGLMDQLQALKWVRENISHFGGDPRQVTVMGQSAGAVDVCLLMTSPVASGLFQRAIMESGDCQGSLNQTLRTPVRYNGLSETAEEAGERLVAELAAPGEGSMPEWLRSIPAAELLDVWDRHRDVQLGAIVDGWIIPEQPAKRFAEGKAIAIPVLVGSNADEATVFGNGGPATIENFREYTTSDTGPFAAQEYAIYRPTSEADVPIRYLQLRNDSFAYGALSMARTVAAHGQQSYLYLFAYAESGKRSALGAYHGEELYFLSDTFPIDWQVDETDAALGKAIRAYWVRFARTGNPNGVGVPEWPAYSTVADDSMSLGRTIHRAPVGVRVNALRQVMNQLLIAAGALGPTNHPK
jgi:para-nitrobenzyl esterase